MATAAFVDPGPRLNVPGVARGQTAFVLSGGGSLGAVQAGMLQALYERNVRPDFLVGVSAGALNAAFICSRPQTVATAKALARVWRRLERGDVFPVSLSALVGGVCGRRNHLVPDGALRQLVRRYLEFDQIQEAPIPLHVVAFDLVEGREAILSDGPALDAVAASAAIPGIFPPVTLGARRLIDGGVINNSPISCAVALGAERIYVLPTQYPCPALDRVPKNAFDAGMHGLGLLISSRLEADIARYSCEVELTVLPAPESVGVQPTDFTRSVSLIRDARTLARTELARQRQGGHLRLTA